MLSIDRVRSLLPLVLLLTPTLASSPAGAQLLPGDLNGDTVVDVLDEPFLVQSYGSSSADPASSYEPAADLDGSGAVGLSDLALFGAAWGSTGGTVDADPPGLFVTVNDIPDDMNDLIVVPPDGFRITLHLDSAGGSAVHPGSLSVRSSQDVGPDTAGSELAGHFTVTPTHAVWEIPAGTELARTSHYLDVEIMDAAGNLASDSYGFAVRDFGSGAPLGNLQTIFLDFGQDFSLGPELDFVEDLRSLGLSTADARFLENQVTDAIALVIVERVNEYYGIAADGTPGPDAVNVAFTATEPAVPHSRICIGGEADGGPLFLGNSILDVENIGESTDTCTFGNIYGVFPQAIRALWGNGASFHEAFDALDPSAGGAPFGDVPLDWSLFDEGFTSADLKLGLAAGGRAGDVANAFDAFAQVVASAIAHEVGHMLGLTAPGPCPAGLYGGEIGTNNQDHNVTSSGGVPSENFLMNRGGAFNFDKMSGRGGEPLPVFRPLAEAYLRDRIVLSSAVEGLFPAPVLDSVDPSPAVYPGPFSPLDLTFYGDGFLAGPLPPTITLVIEGDPTPNSVSSVQFVDAQTLTGQISPLLVPPGLYDVEIRNGDGQVLVLTDYLDVQAP